MAIALGEDDTSIRALKDVQISAQGAALVPAPTRTQQEAALFQATTVLARTDAFWREVHESHRGLIRVLSEGRPYSSYAGPYQCHLCSEYRDALTDSRYRQQTGLRDHYILSDSFSPMFPAEFDADPTGIPLPFSPTDEGRSMRMRPRIDRENELQGLPAQLWVPPIQVLRAPSPPHLWRSVPRFFESSNRELAMQATLSFIAPEHPSRRRDSEHLIHEADSLTHFSRHAQLWRHTPSPSPSLLDPTRLDGALVFGRIRSFLGLPDTSVPADIEALPMLDVSEEEELFSPFVPRPSNNRLPPHITPIPARGRWHSRHKPSLRIRSSPVHFEARRAFHETALSLDWPGPPSPPSDKTEDVEGEGDGEAEEEVWGAYESHWGTDRVPRLGLSPLRNETVVEEVEETSSSEPGLEPAEDLIVFEGAEEVGDARE